MDLEKAKEKNLQHAKKSPQIFATLTGKFSFLKKHGPIFNCFFILNNSFSWGILSGNSNNMDITSILEH